MKFQAALLLFLLEGAIAQLVCPDIPAGDEVCNVCGSGACVAAPDEILVVPGQPEAACGVLQKAGLEGVIPIEFCPLLPGLIGICECMPEGSPDGAPVAPPVVVAPTADLTPAPVVVPTDAPIIVPTDAPVIGPTDAPVNGPTDAPVANSTDAPIAPTPMPTDVIVPDGAPSAEPTTDDSQEQEPSTTPDDSPEQEPSTAPKPSSGGKLLVILLYRCCCFNTSSC
jgi:hypothetical protein